MARANGSDDKHGGLRRREFLTITAASTIGAWWARPVMAGPFDGQEYLDAIPTDKKLAADWVASLTARGDKQTYLDRTALEHIGMPVGGLFAGTVYLSGDGRLWLWDVFNRDQEGILPRSVPSPGGFVGDFVRAGVNFVQPAPVTQPFEFGFSIQCDDGPIHPLDARGFAQVQFDGRYPIGRVTYSDPRVPLAIESEIFSPFIPLNLSDSSLPATILRVKLSNTSSTQVKTQLLAQLANPVCQRSGSVSDGSRRNRIVRDDASVALIVDAVAAETAGKPQPDISFDDFERESYAPWTAEGTAFGQGPVESAKVPVYQGTLNQQGLHTVNSHASAPGQDVGAKDAAQGRLLSRPFTIERRWISLLIGGGNHAGKTCVNLLVDDQAVASVTGQNSNSMQQQTIDAGKYLGRQARLEIVDAESGAWGNIGVDDVIFTDTVPESLQLNRQPDFGSMVLTCLNPPASTTASADRTASKTAPHQATAALDAELVGEVVCPLELEPGASQTLDFVIAWHFPNFYGRGVGGARVGHSYAAQFDSAQSVANYIRKDFDRLSKETRSWVDTWYDSTLPYWLLDRTMANTSTLATTTCYRFADGRFWAWEGVGCCEGTCTHVWHYAQAPGRLFPELERDTRERVDFGVAMHADGAIGHRASLHDAMHSADDGQCGRILGAYRDHQMSANGEFLQRNWPAIKKAVEFLIRKDVNADGMIEDAQPNTLDAAWYGKVSFLASLYLAALQAGAAMADEVGDPAFAAKCRTIADRGAESILQCYNGEYFIQIEDPAHRDAIGVGPGCYIDQVFGQTWAHWVGLGQLFDRDKQLSALRALWKYNFVPDIGAFRQQFTQGRWYAMAGDAGLIMCTWPKGGQRPEAKTHWQYMYFNECMTGFEWQVAAHMIWEGLDQPDLLQAGLAIARAIHDRYDGRLRNPYNEIECSDHYARAMASYGVYQAVSGCHYHGPRGELSFAPRLSPEDFRGAFTAAEGWGSYSQQLAERKLRATVDVRWGNLRLKKLAASLPQFAPRTVQVQLGGRPVEAKLIVTEAHVAAEMPDWVTVQPGTPLTATWIS
ncbi:MAG: GH116 family glycosyl hydrolase [Pirellulales bacterium]